MITAEKMMEIVDNSECMQISRAAVDEMIRLCEEIIPGIAATGEPALELPSCHNPKIAPDLIQKIWNIFKGRDKRFCGARMATVRSIFYHELKQAGFSTEYNANWDTLVIRWGYHFPTSEK